MPIAALDQTFAFTASPAGWAPDNPQPTDPGTPQPPDPNPQRPTSDPLAALVGTWQGRGFNAIWVPRPAPAGGAAPGHFLMLTLTRETLSFSRIAGTIPNRGLLQPDIAMTGLTYMDQISDTAGNGLHIEPGIWAVVPQTSGPAVPASVVRMASIPHGTTILAQGTATEAAQGAPAIGSSTLVPTAAAEGQGPDLAELHLDQATNLRTSSLPPEIDQALIDDPNKLLHDDLGGLSVALTTTLDVTTTNQPVPGGGSANTAFLAGTDAANHQGNAAATRVTSTFWIEEIAADGTRGAFRQLQYSQTVTLDFNGLLWPHVTVATLRQVSTGPEPVVPTPPPVAH